MDELKEKYDDLNNLIANLRIAVDECSYKDYIEELMELMRRIQIEIEEIEPKISKYEQLEQEELLNQFNKERI